VFICSFISDDDKIHQNQSNTGTNEYEFSLKIEDDINAYNNESLKIYVTNDQNVNTTATQLPYSESLSLTPDILDLLKLQHPLISGEQYKTIIETASEMSISSKFQKGRPINTNNQFNFDEIWRGGFEGLLNGDSQEQIEERQLDKEKSRGRGRSPLRRTKSTSRNAHSTGASAKGRDGTTNEGNTNSAAVSDDNSFFGRTRRSRSGPARPIVGRNSKSGIEEVKISVPSNEGNNGTALAYDDDYAALKSLPSSVQNTVSRTKGAVGGVWLVDHPLSLLPPAYYDTYNIIQSSNMTDARRLEWMMDLQREYDEKRFERLEEVLVVSRKNIDNQMKSDLKQLKHFEKKKDDAKLEYYRDKYRQPRW
jgi:hypothetical protein